MTLANPVLAYNLNGINYFSTERPFLDLMKSAYPWQSSAGAKIATLIANGNVDANGWPVSLPAGSTYLYVSLNSEAIPADTYDITYDGTATFAFTRGTVLSSDPGHIVLQTTGTGVDVRVSAFTDLTNIQIVPQRFATLHAQSYKFNPDWLRVVKNARLLRFMDWMRTNEAANDPIDWADRPVSAASNFSRFWKGVPVEWMVELANQLGVDPWFCMPAGSSADYNAGFAAYVHANLDANLVAHVELGNEIWNYLTDQYGAAALAYAWPVDDNGQATWQDWQCKISVENVAVPWDTEYAGADRDRLCLVFGSQTGSTGLVTRAFTGDNGSGKGWKFWEPDAFEAPYTYYDAICMTTYFGKNIMQNSTSRAEMQALAAGANPETTIPAHLNTKLTDATWNDAVPQRPTAWNNTRDALDAAIPGGLTQRMLAYEGGQHLVHGSAGPWQPVEPYLLAYVRSQDGADRYQEMFDLAKDFFDGPFMQFSDVSRETTSGQSFGAWGLRNSLTDTTPRAELLDSLNASETPWWTDPLGRTEMPEAQNSDYYSSDAQVTASTRGGYIEFASGALGTVVVPAAIGDCTRTRTDDGYQVAAPNGTSLIVNSRYTVYQEAA